MPNGKEKTSITPTPNGPYLVANLDSLVNQKGKLDTKPKMALCRCGGSNNKPFCDGTHAKIGFNSAKLEGRTPDQRDNYVGKEVTIHDNRGVCAHAGLCTDKLASVFKLRQEPWIDPDGAKKAEIIEAVKRCPSGALSYSEGGTEHRDQDGAPMISIAPNGPYVVKGGPELVGEARNEGASTEHFTLCRCGGSKNKPFCDGTHWHIKFQDEKN